MAREKELIKENEVDAPTLFIGVGGIGSEIVIHVAEKCKGNETENVNFVCLDTNVNDLKVASASKSHIYVVQTSNTQTVANYLDYDDDAYYNWFPKNAVLYDKTVSEGAGQVRAISRLAFNSALKTGRLKPLTDAIDNLFLKDGKPFQQAMRVIFASSASGGTGSGLILPLSMYVRSYIKERYSNTAVIIRAMILLPEVLRKEIDSSVEKESQYRNAYATIKEINAFMMLKFMDGEERLKRYRNLHLDYTIPGSDELKKLASVPFDFCFLMDGLNNDEKESTSKEQYIEQAAMALYEQNIGPMQRDAFSMEDNIIKEFTLPGNFGRNRFGGLGAATLRYPYYDIADYLAYQWVIESVGGKKDVDNWLQYDKTYEDQKLDDEKAGRPSTETPSRGSIYMWQLASADDAFSTDLRNRFMGGKGCELADERVSTYIEDLNAHIRDIVLSDGQLRSASDSVDKFRTALDYKGADEAELGRLEAAYNNIQDYENTAYSRVDNLTESAVKTLFYSNRKTVNSDKNYMLENLFHSVSGEICHPNAMRYYLYALKDKLDEDVEGKYEVAKSAKDAIFDIKRPNKNYDVKFTRAKESTMQEMVKASKIEFSVIEKIRDEDDKFFKQLNDSLPGYIQAIEDYINKEIEYITMKLTIEYVKDLCEEFEHFYSTFETRTKGLVRLQDDLVRALEFKKGNSVINVCATRELLDEMWNMVKSDCQKDCMLDNDVNGQIFDGIKTNVMAEREARNLEVVEEDKSVDIFGDVLVEYFKDAVCRICGDSIDLNIIRAIAMEKRLKHRISLREEQQNKDSKEVSDDSEDRLKSSDYENYIRDIIAEARLLAAPSIEGMPNAEPRMVKLSAYNKSLLDMREYNVRDDLVEHGSAVDSVSKYEIRFFNALYNLTPDKLSKFSCYHESDTGEKGPGLYHNAYIKYERGIGPDSTKNLSITTHIDKRWDSLAVLPEIDLNYHYQCMLRIHEAMIYALIHNAITYEDYSSETGDDMKVYKYTNSQDMHEDIVVSNCTPCDQFYEILDALYINPAMIEDIDVIKEQKRKKNEIKQSSYQETVFKHDLDSFSIDEIFNEVKVNAESQEKDVENEEGAESEEDVENEEGAESEEDAESKKEDAGSKEDADSKEENKTTGEAVVKEKEEHTSLFEIPLVYYNSLPSSKRYDSEITDMVDAAIQVITDEMNRWENKQDVDFKLCKELLDQFDLLVANREYFSDWKYEEVVDIIFRKIKHVMDTSFVPDSFAVNLQKSMDKLKAE